MLNLRRLDSASTVVRNTLRWRKLRSMLQASKRRLSDEGAKHNPYVHTHSSNARVVGAEVSGNVKVVPVSKYGGITHITVLTGNSLIGKQGAKYVKAILQSARVPVEVESIGVDEGEEYFNSVLRTRAALHIDIVHDKTEKKKSLRICSDLDLYVFMTRVRSFKGFNCRFPNVDIQLIAQNNMGQSSDLEYSPVEGIVEGLHVVTREATERFLRFALSYVRIRKRKRVVLVHKKSEWPVSEGIFVDIATALHQKEFPEIELELMDLHKCVGLVILNPNYFDVILTNDLYGTFMATILSGVCGGSNLFSSVEIGDHHAVFKPLQTKLSLTNYKNLSPYGIVATCVELMLYLGHINCASALWDQMMRSMCEGIKTAEFKGKDGGEYVICNIMNQLQCKMFDDTDPNKPKESS
ncbi:CG7755 [Drosophila busckii]|uniref:CG7755 n=1 Tax=Drosophila busckii TaxID=30019 RepID=A0A0M4EX53_DROBS|nr:isocitrate dehydrogenase [NAD] subunit 1, mitochondrial [Drosophila busckii]ALC42520.1 CG7755 [Drosophila busckii]